MKALQKIFKYSILLIFIPFTLTSCFTNDDGIVIIQDSLCEGVVEIISVTEFEAINTQEYGISEVVLSDDCLEITVSASGCDPETWEMNLYSMDSFYLIFTAQRPLRIELINNQDCLAIFEKTISFDLTPLQLEEQNELPINLEGWQEQILYQY